MNRTLLLTVCLLFAQSISAVKEQVNITNREPIGGRAMEIGTSIYGHTYYVNAQPNQQVTIAKHEKAVMHVRVFHNGHYITSGIPQGTHFKVSIEQGANANSILKVEREN
jgi:hypothetical protein